MKLSFILIGAGVALATPAMACEELDVTISGTLSKEAAASSPTENSASDSSLAVSIPLEKIGITDTTVVANLIRAQSDQWRVALSHEFRNQTNPFVMSPVVTLQFEDDRQSLPQSTVILPFTSGDKAGVPVKITFENIRIASGNSSVAVTSAKVEDVECRPELAPKIKSVPDHVRDELNPMSAAELEVAVNGGR